MGGKVYLCGGTDATGFTTDVWEYDPATDVFTPRAPMPSPQRAPGFGVVDGMLYLVGGDNGSMPVGLVQVYDPATDTWSTASATLPQPRSFAGSGVVDGKIVVVGGVTTVQVDAVHVYDPVGDAFTSGAAAPTVSLDPTTVVVHGELLVLCPFDGAYLDRVDAYDPATDTWRPLLSTRNVHFRGAAEVLDDRVHLTGGWNGSSYVNDHDVYQPAGPTFQVMRRK